MATLLTSNLHSPTGATTLTTKTMTRFMTRRSTVLLRVAGCAFLLAAAGACRTEPGALRGEMIFDTCAPCHGMDGAGDETLGAPAIAGSTDWYLTSQLNRFREGVRGYHYQDAEGLRMRPMSRALLTDEDLVSIVDYVVSLEIVDPPATLDGDVEAGEAVYEALCSNCHGIDGRGVDAATPELNAPSLLHLNDWYIQSALRKYRDGVRGALPGDNAGAIMRNPVLGMSDEEIADVTAFVMTLQRLPRRIPGPPPEPLPPLEVDPSMLPEGVTAAMAQEGQDLFHGAGLCASCHLRQGVGGGLAPDLTDDVWLHIDGDYEAIVQIIMDGVEVPIEAPGPMPARGGSTITDEQVRAVAAYVYILSR
ncbi:MAG: c-type cytochrome [Gemmatimonadetes bacterium]|nr:c-type cytochrome [Gemmatimonadota bacterium]